MNIEPLVASGKLITQLNAHLAGDAECAALLTKLAERTIKLSFDQVDERTFVQKVFAHERTNRSSPEETMASVLGAMNILKREADQYFEKKAKCIELIDTYEAYVKALETRCSGLLEEVKRLGGDTANYPEISKP